MSAVHVSLLYYQLEHRPPLTTPTNLSYSIATVLNQYINPVGVENAGWKFYIFYDIFLCVIFVTVYFLWVETKNTPLEEIAKYFDGDDAKVGGTASTGVAAVVLEQMRAKGELVEVEQVERVDGNGGIERV